MTPTKNEPESFYINPLHAQFALSNLSHQATVVRLLELLDGLDESDRDKLLGLPAFALNAKPGAGVDNEDEAIRARYEHFKRACTQLPVLDCFTVYGVVMQVLNIHRDWSDYQYVNRSIEWQAGFAEFAERRGNLSPEEIEHVRRQVEERAVNARGDVKLARGRYNLFCERVVRPLLEMK